MACNTKVLNLEDGISSVIKSFIQKFAIRETAQLAKSYGYLKMRICVIYKPFHNFMLLLYMYIDLVFINIKLR